jgi:non-ribosomal peptide synthetase component F
MTFQQITARAKTQNFKVEKTSGGHWKFTPPTKGAEIVITSGTPSDHRSIDNFLARMRRSGFNDGRRRQHHG